MAALVRMSRNSVNLGTLYSVVPKPRPRTGGHGVNLGILYDRPRPAFGQPTGWAYFEDGSIYMHTYPWGESYMAHDEVEAEMKLLECIVRDPPPSLGRFRADNPSSNRLILATLHPVLRQWERRKPARILARCAADFEGITSIVGSFLQFSVYYNRYNPSQPTVKHYFQRVVPSARYMRNALTTFRGTLVDGILQPNFRIGNGLALDETAETAKGETRDLLTPQTPGQEERATQWGRARREVDGFEQIAAPHSRRFTSPKERATRLGRPRRTPHSRHLTSLERREAEIEKKQRQLLHLQQQLLRQSTMERPHPGPGFGRSHQQISHTYPPAAGTYLRAAELEAKERELQQREEILRWKHQNFFLKQQLAEAKGRGPRDPYGFEHGGPATALEYDPESSAGRSSHSPAAPDASDQRPASSNGFPELDSNGFPKLDDPAAPNVPDQRSVSSNGFPELDDFSPPGRSSRSPAAPNAPGQRPASSNGFPELDDFSPSGPAARIMLPRRGHRSRLANTRGRHS